MLQKLTWGSLLFKGNLTMKGVMNHLDTQFHMPNAYDSLVIAIKLTAKYICTGRIFTLLTGSTVCTSQRLVHHLLQGPHKFYR
jgi:hypothetical protein